MRRARRLRRPPPLFSGLFLQTFILAHDMGPWHYNDTRRPIPTGDVPFYLPASYGLTHRDRNIHHVTALRNSAFHAMAFFYLAYAICSRLNAYLRTRWRSTGIHLATPRVRHFGPFTSPQPTTAFHQHLRLPFKTDRTGRRRLRTAAAPRPCRVSSAHCRTSVVPLPIFMPVLVCLLGRFRARAGVRKRRLPRVTLFNLYPGWAGAGGGQCWFLPDVLGLHGDVAGRGARHRHPAHCLHSKWARTHAHPATWRHPRGL